MSKHRKEHHEEEENAERWLLTYSDLITLLLALFIILYSIAQVDAKKFNAVAEQFRQQMGTETAGGSSTVVIEVPLELDVQNQGDSGKQVEGGGALAQIYNTLSTYIQQNNLQDQIQLVNTDNYVRIHIKDTLMFQPDSAKLLSDNSPVFQTIEKAIEQVYEQVDYITFSGHTADVGNDTLLSDQTSWRLSTERAITVLNLFISYGLQQNKLSIQGFAHFMPVADNATEAGRAQNRRVEITIYKYPEGDYMSADQRAAVNS